MKAPARTFWLGLLGVTIVTLGHYLTPSSSPQFHDALRRLYYLPIALVGVRCGVRGGLTAATVAVVTYFPHIWTHWGGDPLGPENLNRTFEMLMWLIVGGLCGLLADRERDAARSLVDAQDKLRQADRLATLGLLSASLAHEIRNPLASLRGIADTLRRDFPEGHPRRELVDILDEEVRRLNDVLDAHLEHARMRPGQGPAAVEPVAHAVLRLLQPESRKRNVTCTVTVEPPDLQVPVPEDLARQVLVNLVLNSLHAIDDATGRVEIRADRAEGATEIRITDDGPGFPDGVLGEDPQPFFTTRGYGTGLGLPIVRQIVERHGGKLRLENRPAGGASACITFEGASS